MRHSRANPISLSDVVGDICTDSCKFRERGWKTDWRKSRYHVQYMGSTFPNASGARTHNTISGVPALSQRGGKYNTCRMQLESGERWLDEEHAGRRAGGRGELGGGADC